MTDDTGLLANLRRAFKWHWHLLGLGTGATFAVLSGAPAAFLPLVGAAELAYLGFLGLNPRFQNVLRGQAKLGEATGASGQLRETPAQRYHRIASFLSEQDLRRFEALRQRCAGLIDLRRRMEAQESAEGAESFRGDSLDRMLWLFLKLLHQKACLERFLCTTEREQIEAERRTAETQLAESTARDEASGVESRITTSIRERLQTIAGRLENHQKAVEAWQLACAEIDKTEQQITHLCEVGMTQRDAAGLTAKIDSISESMQASERAFAHPAISELLDDDAPPPMITSEFPRTIPLPPPPLPRKVSQ